MTRPNAHLVGTSSRPLHEMTAALADWSQRVDWLQSELKFARSCRDELVRQLIGLGLSEREVASVAGITGQMVHKIKGWERD